MIQQAQAAVEKRGLKLNVYASPWSPPAWMKLPVGGQQSMVMSAAPGVDAAPLLALSPRVVIPAEGPMLRIPAP